MNCTTCLPELSAFVDNQLEPARRHSIEAHLGECAHCRAECEALLALGRDLAGTFAALKSRAPQPPVQLAPVAAPSPAERRPARTRASWLRLAASLMVLGGLAWLAAAQLFTPKSPLGRAETARLERAGSAALERLTEAPEFLVHVPAGAPARHFHFAKGPGGAYLWQPATETSTGFDRTRYLAGSDGQELWVSAPRAQRLAVTSSQPPLPRLLSLALAALAEPGASEATRLTLDPADPSRAWFHAEASTAGGPVSAWIELDRASAEPLAFRLGVQPGASLDLALVRPSGPLDFDLEPRAPMTFDLTATQTPLDNEPLPDALWALGYTPGVSLPPEALEDFSDPIFGIGYL